MEETRGEGRPFERAQIGEDFWPLLLLEVLRAMDDEERSDEFRGEEGERVGGLCSSMRFSSHLLAVPLKCDTITWTGLRYTKIQGTEG